MIYQHEAGGADRAITSAIDAPVESDRGREAARMMARAAPSSRRGLVGPSKHGHLIAAIRQVVQGFHLWPLPRLTVRSGRRRYCHRRCHFDSVVVKDGRHPGWPGAAEILWREGVLDAIAGR
jgi:hypothetical protein